MKRRHHTYASEIERGFKEIWQAMQTLHFWLVMGMLLIILVMVFIGYTLSMSYDSFAARFANKLACRTLADQDALLLILLLPAFILVSLLSLGELFLFIEARKKKRKYEAKHLLIFIFSAIGLGIGGAIALKAFC